jgi:hypothetical protein
MSLHLSDLGRVHTLHGISKDFVSSGLRLVRRLGDFFHRELR